jgi:branched-chain amino acid transport system ATP-binding protein
MKPSLETKKLTKYFGGLGAVKDVDFIINPGEIVSLIGPNGAGKTTFFDLVTGFLQPTKGKIFYKEENITNLKPHEVAARGIIRTFQKTKVFPGVTILEGVIMGSHRLTNPHILGILGNTAATRKEEEKIRGKALDILNFLGIEHRKDMVAKNLPYGEQRILEIAVALAANPELLLLDEPATGMNPEETKRLMKLIYKIREKGITVLLVEHDMNVVMGISDIIVVFDSGEVIARGLPQEIREDKEVIKAYLGEEYLYA